MKINVLLTSVQIRGIDGTGGLGDVPVGLSRFLSQRCDVDIRLVMPGFTTISEKGLDDRFSGKPISSLAVPFGASTQIVDVYKITLPRLGSSVDTSEVQCYLLRCPKVFDRPENDGKVNKNSPDKAVLFSRATMEFLLACDEFRVDLIHCNDWHTGLIPVMLRTIYRRDPYLGRIATLYTTHNAEGGYQGAFSNADELLTLSNLDSREVFSNPLLPSVIHDNMFNFCKGGFCFADSINTVSRQYREELLTPAFGGGLSGVLQQLRAQFSGIINGIDTNEWNPAADDNLKGITYSVSDDVKTILKQKKKVRGLIPGAIQDLLNKKKLEYASPTNFSDDSVLIGIVSRIDYQKTEILLPVMEKILQIDKKFQVVLLGAPGIGDPHGASQAKELARIASVYGNKFLFYQGFDISLSHLIYAASEIFVVPSVFEPCGLTQQVAMRYGSIPVVRSTGGLVDTVVDEATSKSANGFRFKERIPDPNERMEIVGAGEALVDALECALDTWLTKRDRRDELIFNGMKSDWSWIIPGMGYMKLYHEAIRTSLSHSYFD
jgi:starch synthase